MSFTEMWYSFKTFFRTDLRRKEGNEREFAKVREKECGQKCRRYERKWLRVCGKREKEENRSEETPNRGLSLMSSLPVPVFGNANTSLIVEAPHNIATILSNPIASPQWGGHPN